MTSGDIPGRFFAGVAAIDEAVFDRVAAWHSPALDATLPLLSDVANYHRIWLAITGSLAILRGRRGRRLAAEALLAMTANWVIVNGMKLASRRRRPQTHVPASRRLRQPASSSFPSAHAAAGAVFSGVVGRRLPVLWLPLNLVAAAVGFSRTYTGVHHPSDIVAGWLVGKAVASVVLRVTERS